MIPAHQWRSTHPSGKAHTHGADDGQTGWRLHAVPNAPAYGPKTDDNPGYKWRPALCGTKPGTGWGVDLFIEDECTRCLKWLAKRGDEKAKAVLERRALIASSFVPLDSGKATNG